MEKKRKSWIDIARGIGILLVVLGHVTKNEDTVKLIYSFHMPLFFFLSGYLFDRNQYDIRTFVTRKAKNLLIPYLFFYLLTLTLYYLVEVRVQSGDPFTWRLLIPLVWGSNVNGLMAHNIVLWFLPALFSTEVLFRILSEWFRPVWLPLVVGLCAAAGLLCYAVRLQGLPMGVNVALIALVFYATGNLLKKHIDAFSCRKVLLPTLFVGCTAVLFVALMCGGLERVDMASGRYGNFALFVLWAMTGIGMVASLSLLIDKSAGLEYVGHSDTSLVIMCFHGMILRAVLFVTVRLTGLEMAWVRNNVEISLAVTLITVLICLPLAGICKYVKENLCGIIRK